MGKVTWGLHWVIQIHREVVATWMDVALDLSGRQSVAASALVKLPRLSGSNFWLSLIPHSTPSPPRFAPESTSINEPTIDPDDVKPSLRSDIRPFPTKAVDSHSPDPADSRLEIPLRKKRSARIARSDSRSATGATLAHQPSLAEPSTMSFHPQTPQSPSQFSSGTSEPALGVATSMTATATATTLPTPAHSVSGSASHHDVAMADDSPHKRKRSVDDSGDREQKKVHVEESKLGIEDLHLDVGKKYLLCQTRKAPCTALSPLLLLLLVPALDHTREKSVADTM
ncbi:hypothetical protein MRS44_012529 [Fusarium solani]|uniref:uncharacterized protein n=1 Tax=Fusarium solani TaxID=169388 RepID=UPI0032C3EF44|nr:hypothetical protein MRS44_012529 [Fusarium solani]